MKAKIILILNLLLTVSVFAQDTINFFDPEKEGLTKLLDLSKEKGKDVFIYFTATWCAPCIKMEKEVFPDAEVVTLFNDSFICVKTQQSKNNEEHSKLRNQYDFRGYPHLIIINYNRDIVHRIPRAALGSGYKTKEELIQFGKEALENEVSYAALKEKYDKGDRSYETISGYLKMLTPVAMKVVDGLYDNQTQRVLDSYFATQSKDDLASPNNWYLINNYVDNASTEPFQYLLKNSEVFYEKYGKGVVDKRIFKVLDWYGFSGSMDRLENAKLEMKRWDYPAVNALLTLDAANKNHYNDLNRFVKEVDEIYIIYYQGLSGYINRTAWEIYEASNEENSTISLETFLTAEQWMKLITEEYPSNAHYKETYAKIQEWIKKH